MMSGFRVLDARLLPPEKRQHNKKHFYQTANHDTIIIVVIYLMCDLDLFLAE